MSASIETSCFSHNWTAEILTQRPMILPSRHYTYPATVEEVERGALEILIQPILIPPALPSSVAFDKAMKPPAQPFLATCALGFRDAAAPTGLWSCPDPNWICAVSGGYAYLIDVENPERFTFLRYRPVLEILPYSVDLPKSEHDRLLLFIGHHSILAWGKDGEAWESDRLSSEGITNLHINGKTLRGEGWDLMTDKDLPFALDLETGKSFSIDQ